MYDDDFLLTPTQASSITGLSASTLAKRRLTGDGPIFTKLGARVFYRYADLLEWIRSRRFSSTSEYAVAR